MINALHLLWIIPLSAMVGILVTAIFAVGKNSEYDDYIAYRDKCAEEANITLFCVERK